MRRRASARRAGSSRGLEQADQFVERVTLPLAHAQRVTHALLPEQDLDDRVMTLRRVEQVGPLARAFEQPQRINELMESFASVPRLAVRSPPLSASLRRG